MSDSPDKIASRRDDLSPSPPPESEAEEQEEIICRGGAPALNDAVDEFEVQVRTHGDSQPNHREEALAARALKRAEKAIVNELLAAERAQSGEERLQRSDISGALDCYADATNLCNTNPSYFMGLARTYRRLSYYDTAADYATIALTLDPTAVEPRYFRGLMRMHQGVYGGAQIDFDTVLGLDQGHLEAQRSLEELSALKESDTYHFAREDDTVDDYTSPAPDSDIWERECHSYSSDFNHAGNGTPCRSYNHDGCSRGVECEFSHAPDEKSVRDKLGRNVCAYDLLDSCTSGDACLYSHDRDCLPQRGWWTDAQRAARTKKDLKLGEEEALEKWMYERAFYLEMHHEQSLQPPAPAMMDQSADGASTSQAVAPNNPRRTRCEYLGHGRIGIYHLEEDEEMTGSGFPNGFPESFTMHDGSVYPKLMVGSHL